FEQPAYGPRIIMRCSRPAQPWRAAAGGDLLPCHPIDEEHDVASFFVYQRLEDVEHRFRQKAGAACNLEHAETEKRIEAFAIPEIGEGTVQIAARRLWWALLCGDAVTSNHQPQQLGVARFFEPLKRNRFAHERIGDCRGIGSDDRSGA